MPDEIKATTTKVQDAIHAINTFHTKYVAFKRSCAAMWKGATDYATDVKNLPFDLANEGKLWGERGLVAAIQYANQEFLTDGERAELAQLMAIVYGKAEQAAIAVQDKIVKETKANTAKSTSTVAKSKTAKKTGGAGAAKGGGKKSVLEQGSSSDGGIILKPKALQGAKDEFNEKYGDGAVKW